MRAVLKGWRERAVLLLTFEIERRCELKNQPAARQNKQLEFSIAATLAIKKWPPLRG